MEKLYKPTAYGEFAEAEAVQMVKSLFDSGNDYVVRMVAQLEREIKERDKSGKSNFGPELAMELLAAGLVRGFIPTPFRNEEK